MNQLPLDQAVPHSPGVNRPLRAVPAFACDSHMHIFDPRFPASPHWTRTPPVATVADYRQLQARLGTSRTVIVTPSTYGTDNRCTVDALDQFGDTARGVAVVDLDVTRAELARLDHHRVRGLRVNFVTPQAWGETTAAHLTALGARIADLGWHLQIFVHPAQLIALEPVLADLPVPLVIDHLARIDPRDGAAAPAFKVLARLLEAGNTWVKLSGAYMRSVPQARARSDTNPDTGPNTYADTIPLGRALVALAPERLVWGSDWPHTTATPDSVNDATLMDLLYDWAGSDAIAEQILVGNAARLYRFDSPAVVPGH